MGDLNVRQEFESSRISLDGSTSSTDALTFDGAVSTLTTILSTVEVPITQPATTATITSVRTIPVTDPASYSSLLAAESTVTQSVASGSVSVIVSTPIFTPTSTPTPHSSINLPLILGLVLGILAIFIIALLAAIYVIKRKRRKMAGTSSQDYQAPDSGAAIEFTTADQINQAVEARFAAEKASRMVHVSSQPIDTISIDSREHGRATVIETTPDPQTNHVHSRNRGAAVNATEARLGFGPVD